MAALKDASITNFGLLIAYLLPGFVALWGISFFSPSVASWFGSTAEDAPTVGGFLYVTLASVAAGLTVSTVRWLVIDSVHHVTGIRNPRWDFSRLKENVAALDMLIEIHYRYYQFYANMIVAVLFTVAARHVTGGMSARELVGIDVGAIFLCLVFFLGSRDTLRKYYARSAEVLLRRRPPVRQGRK